MLIFDLDGTLWDAGQALADSWGEELVRAAGIDKHFTADDIHAVMGLPMNEIADHLLPEVELPRRHEIFRSCEAYEIEYLNKHGAELFPAVRETLDELLDAGYGMSIVSNCQQGYINAFINSMDMHKYFSDQEEWGRTKLSKAENIRLVMDRNDYDEYIYIGDIQKDSDAAHAAGIECINAAFGFGNIEDGIDTIETFGELPACLKRIDF